MRTLHVTTPLMFGADVLNAQKKLRLAGFSPGALDGKYGAATATAVKAFQRAHNIQADSILGPNTWAILSTGPTKTMPAPPGTGRDFGRLMLQESLKHLGVKESPAGSNNNPFGEWIGCNRAPWCANFCSYCSYNGAGITLCHGSAGAGVLPRGCAYCPTIEAWLRHIGTWIGLSAPVPGMLVLYHFGHSEAVHIGIVEQWLGNGKFTAIEGNTGHGSDANGGEVMRQERYISQVRGFGAIR